MRKYLFALSLACIFNHAVYLINQSTNKNFIFIPVKNNLELKIYFSLFFTLPQLISKFSSQITKKTLKSSKKNIIDSFLDNFQSFQKQSFAFNLTYLIIIEFINISIEFPFRSSQTMDYRPVISFKGENFPFSTVQDRNLINYRRIFVRKRVYYKNQSQYESLQQKIGAMKKAHHQNFINIKSIVQTERGYIDILYNYVHYKLDYLVSEGSFSIKKIHQQLIRMIVHAAKHFIIIPFESKNCGLKIIKGERVIKYYFPIDEIKICNEIKGIERSVQLFTVQSMQFLDELIFGRNDRSNEISFRSPIQNKRLTFTSQRQNNSTELIPSINLFSERYLRNSVDLNYRLEGNQWDKLAAQKTDASTLHTIPTSEEGSKQKKFSFFGKSLEKRLAIREELRVKIQKLKQRSKEALTKLNEIKGQLEKRIREKDRKDTNQFNLLKRFSFDQHVRQILRSR